MRLLFSTTLVESPSYAVENASSGRDPITEAAQRINTGGFLTLLSSRFSCSFAPEAVPPTDYLLKPGGDLSRTW